MTKDYYKILGVAEFDSAENIKTAYRKLARKWHPDVAGSSKDVLSRFKEINEAYNVLSDKTKRAEYDKAKRFYDYAKSCSDPKNNSAYKTTNPTKETKESRRFVWEDLINRRKSDKSFKKEEIRNSKKGDDVYTEIELTLFEALTGVAKTINMLQTRVCEKCSGRKFINGALCQKCNGKGVVTEYKKFSVKIPAGIKNFSKIRLAGEGEKGSYGGKNGDLYVKIIIKDSQTCKTDGLNLLKVIPITPFEAVLGGDITVNTFDGVYKVKLAPNTQNGQKIRLAGCGIMQNGKVGDMILTVEIKIPDQLTIEEINLYKKLKELSPGNIRE